MIFIRKSMLLTMVAFLPASWAATPSMRIYSTADGLARNDINRIFSDSRGFLWFATEEGLSRFDGLSFRNYGTQDGLPDHNVLDIVETKDGFWVATARGLARLDPDAAVRHLSLFTNPATSKESFPILKLLPDVDGHSLLCATPKGLFRFDVKSSEFTLQPVVAVHGGPEPRIEDLFRDRSGSLWILTSKGLVRRGPDAKMEKFGLEDGLPSLDLRCVASDAEGRIWVGTKKGLCRLRARRGPSGKIVDRVYTTRDGLGSDWINDLMLRRDGNFSVVTGRSISFLSRRQGPSTLPFFGYGIDTGLPPPSSIGEDRAGNLWLGTYRGAVRLTERDFFLTYGSADGLAGNVKSIFEDREGKLCATADERDGYGVALFCRDNNFRFTRIVPKKDGSQPIATWGWGQIHMQDHLGEWWIPTGNGLYRYPRVASASQLSATRPSSVYGTKDGLPQGLVFRLFEDSRGDLWISYWNEDALVRWHRASGIFERIAELPGLPNSFAEDRAGNIWMGFYAHNLVRFRDGHFTVLSPQNGFPPGGVQALFVDHAGRLWASTEHGGLVRINEPAAEPIRYTVYTTQQGLSSDHVTAITEDRWGNIYATTGRGIDRLNPVTGDVRHFDAIANNAAFRDSGGRLWFASQDGLRMLKPGREQDAEPPDARIDKVRVRGRPWPLSEFGETALQGIELASANNQLEFDFFALNLDPGRKVAYQYRLDGIDHDWNAPAPLATVNYASVPPGSYRFQVRTVDSLGRPSPRPAMVAFRILPPLWRRWWFLTGALALTLLLAVAAYNYRVNRLLELLRIRTRIATDLHDDIGSSLSQIALLSEVARRENGKGEALTRIGSISRDLVDSMSDVVWSIDPRWDRVADLVSRMRGFAGELLSPRAIEYRFEAQCPEGDLKLHPDTRRNVFLVFKEALHNVVKHARCGNVSIALSIHSDQVALSVEDDGQGFDPSPRAEKGHGLRSMRARAAELGGQLEIQAGTRGGTRVVLLAPLKGAATSTTKHQLPK